MPDVVDRALAALVEEEDVTDWLMAGHTEVVADLVRWRGFHDALGAGLDQLACEILDLPEEHVLRAYGRSWGIFGALTCHSDDLEGCLVELGLQGGRMLVEHAPDGTMVVHHFSGRPGLAPVVAGVVEGLGARFGTPVEVDTEHLDNRDAFHVREVHVTQGGVEPNR